jgi:hypothetical protein
MIEVKVLRRMASIEPLALTAEDWQLYTASMDCGNAALELNQTFTGAVNSGFGRRQVRELMAIVMHTWREYGAEDTEPRSVVGDLVDRVFGEWVE